MQHYTFCNQKVHAHFGKTVLYPISHFTFSHLIHFLSPEIHCISNNWEKSITILRDFDEISTILMQYQPQIQKYQPFKQNGRLSTIGQ